jgi:DNA-binding transcriptional LysR family regulator
MAKLPWLQTFLAVYRAGSITAAAPRLFLTQPAVSQQIRALESRLGQRLFERLPRGTVPTPAAHELARRVAPHLDVLEAAMESTPRGLGSLAGTVRLGGPAEFLGERVLPALASLAAQDVRLDVHLGLAAPLLEMLAEGALDLAVSTQPVRRSGIESEPLYEEAFVLVGAPVWGARLPAEVIAANGAGALDGVPLVSYGTDLPILRRYWRVVFGARLAAPAAVVVPDLRGVREAVVAGAGVSVLPVYLCERSLSEGGLVVLHRAASAPRNTLHLAWRTDTLREARLGYVRNLLVQGLGRYDPPGAPGETGTPSAGRG